ncbi:MAG TPA: EamA family transporter [Fimbriiglobus sp.]|jgi:drug/metabolite transporter (DMT)-like permease
MKSTLLPFAAVVVGGVIYQLAMKAVPRGSNPFAVLAAAYGMATAACMLAMLRFDPSPRFADVANWSVLLVAVGLVLIEAGFLFAYRSGAKLGAFSFVGLAVASAVLLVVGAIAYAERLTGREWAGIGICFLGLLLMKTGGADDSPL